MHRTGTHPVLIQEEELMADSRNILNTSILNEDFTLSSDQPLEKLQSIVKYVDRKMKEIYVRMPMASYKKIAVLAALNIAEEYFLEHDKTQPVPQQAQQQAPEIHSADSPDPGLLARADALIRKLESV
jgi:cell division protein ZapA